MVGKEGTDYKMTQDKPYFMSNPEWFYFDEKEWKYFLTDKAPNKAKESYTEFYGNINLTSRTEVNVYE